ncbi:serine hydrolase [Paracoccus albus]|uniref:serine hydrolase n=1 Tax=Paracoccus albus TaxID=3017784 RepID=UPI0022F01A7D|nr:serine hydrolase [Paracoccus albus]WBU58996.1 serine hydrolase [Paracoccus albus]
MSQQLLSRRLFLGSAAAGALIPGGLLAELSPPQTPGVAAPDEQIGAAIGRVDEIVGGIMTRTGVPGIAVAVVHKGETVLARGYGPRRIGETAEITPDTVFQLASVSKSIGATVVARQVADGVVTWDARMADLLPWFELSDPGLKERLTIGDLYSHRSGLPDHAGDDLEDLGFDRRVILERLRLLPLAAFRSSYAYTNFGLTAAAEAVSQAAGMDWASLSEQSLYAPLGMGSTSSRFADYMGRENRAIPHARSGDGFAPLYQRDPDAQSPAGGVSASVSDMAIWMKMVLSGGQHEGAAFIAGDALLPAISPQSISSPPGSADARAGFYGYGFNVGVDPSGRVRLSHSGGFDLGAGTCFSLIPSLDLGIAVLSNAAPIGAVEAIAEIFTELAQLGHERRDWLAAYQPLFAPFYVPRGRTTGQSPPVDAGPALPGDLCIGRYAHPYFGEVEVRDAGGELVLAAGPEPVLLSLSPWDGATMVFDFVTENAPAGSRSTIEFEVAGEGPARAVVIELFGEDGPSRFIRI